MRTASRLHSHRVSCINFPRHPSSSLSLLLLALVGLGLLEDIVLDATLLSLALSTHLFVVGLSSVVAGDARNGTSNGSLDTTSNTAAKVGQLALSLLLLTLEVLLATGGL